MLRRVDQLGQATGRSSHGVLLVLGGQKTDFSALDDGNGRPRSRDTTALGWNVGMWDVGWRGWEWDAHEFDWSDGLDWMIQMMRGMVGGEELVMVDAKKEVEEEFGTRCPD